MKLLRIKIQLIVILVLATTQVYGQLTVNNTPTALNLAQTLAGPNITINTASLTGANVASGSFNGVNSNIGMNSGVILSTGDIANAPGPNNSAGGGDNLGQAGTAQMDALAGANTFDAMTLQFSFNVQSDFIQFQYIFASEEYPEYAPPNSSAFNDVFAFYISGPGIVGQENIALVPGTGNPVTINNINAITNNQYYVDNTGGTTVQYDAWTSVLTAEKQGLTPCQEYTMTLVIADAGDEVWNSAVFLLENSFIQGVVDVNTQTVNADNIALEGCIPAQFNFSLDVPSSTDTQIIYQIGGTATNGIDYQFIDTVVTIPAGDTTASIIINSISDGLTEGQEVIYIIFQPDLCSPPDTAFLYINDAQPIQFSLVDTDLTCHNDSSGQILVNATGGFPPYTYHVTDNSGNGTTSQYTNNPITNLPADTYSVQVYDIYGCKADALVIGGIYDADTTFLPDGTGVSYQSSIPISGFQNGQQLTNMTQLQQVCATMEHSYLGDLQIKIISPTGQEVILKQFNGGGSCDLGEPFASGPVDGANSNLTNPGVGYDYCWNASPNYGTMVAESNNYTHTIPASTGGTYTDNYLPAGAYDSFQNLNGLLGSDLNGNWILEVSDQFNLDNGYIFDWNISLASDLPDTLVTIDEPDSIAINGFITQAQCGGADGAIDLSVTGDFAPFTFAWSNGATTEDITGLTAGTYSVVVTDANGCSDSASFNLNNISSLNITSNVTQVTCAGGSNGGIDVTTSGGTPAYTYGWSSGQTSEDITGVMAGTYTYTVTDVNGCVYSEDITVGTIPSITIALNSSSNEVCSFDNGSIDISVSGGSGSYGFSWDNGATTEDLSNIGAGTYTVTVTDANGCSAMNSFSIINDVSNCSAFCFTNIVTQQVVNELCGDGSGSIDISVMDATPPYNVSWSNGATTDDISGLTAGTYTVTILDANQCELIQNFTVLNDAGNLAISSDAITNENCGNGDGTIDITVAGGTAPYSFSWDNGATTEDVNGLAAGSYQVTITDNSGCSIVQSFSVGNNVGTLTESAIVSPEICGNGGGTINLTVTGGVGPYNYSWSNGSSNEDLVLLSAGNYTVTITDNVGCTLISQSYTVANTAGDLTLVSSNVTNENCSDAQGAIDITVIQGNPPYTFSWTNGAITEDLTGLSAGNYTGTITDANGCQITTPNLVVFNQGGSLTASTNSTTDEVCGDATGQIDIQTTGGTGPYTYLWSNGATTEDITGLAAGSYSVTITDANGCTYDYVESVQNASPGFSVAVNSTTDENCGDGSGAIDIAITGGVGPINYLWSNGATTEDLSGINAGNYTVQITDANGCIINTAASIAGGGININSSNISDEICGDLSGAIDISFVGGVNPYTFVWSNGASTEDVSGLAAGSYSVTITGSGGCTANGNYTVNNNTNGLAIVSTIVTDENCGDGAGAIDVTTTGGSLPFTYNWDNGGLTEDLFGLSAGSYNLVLTDVNGCSVNTSGTVINNAAGFAGTVDLVVDENCGDGTGSIDVSISGGVTPYAYSWDNGATTEDLSGLSAGTYVLTVTEAGGCSIVLNATVNNTTTGLTISNAVISDASCTSANGFIDLSITGGAAPYTFAWSNGATTEDISGLNPGTYTCVITDNSGCIINYSGTVSNTGGGITATPTIQNELCGNAGGVITVNVSGGIAPYTYSWTGGTPNTCCDYTLEMLDQGNSWNGAFITVLINGISVGDFTVPGGGANTETFNACTGDNIDLVWNSGAFDNEVSFDLLDPNGTIIFSQGGGPTPGSLFTTTAVCPASAPGTTEISGLSAGSYSLTITDAVGCQITEVYNIANTPSDIATNVVTVTDESCANNNGEIVYTISGGTGPFTTTANGFTDGPPVGTLSNLFADDWEIITIDANGCTDTIVVTVNNIATFTVADVIVNENCADGTGSIDLTITGGSANMDYVWDNGATTEDLTGLSAGTYTVTITDLANGCEDVQTYTVGNTLDITLSAILTNENCNDGTGAIDLTVTGSTDISVSWDNGAITEDISGLNAGVYTVTVTNNLSGCVAIESYTINNNTTGVSASAVVTDENCSNVDGAIDLTVSGGVGPFTFAWDNGATTEDISSLSPGTYTVTVTDQNDGCQLVQSYTVNSVGTFNVDLISVTNEVCGNGSGAIDIDVNGPGTFNPTVLWTPGGQSTEDITGISAGTYTVSVTNAGGCEITLPVTVGNDVTMTLSATTVNEVCGDATGSIDLTITGSTGPFSYLWSNGPIVQDPTGLSAGNYGVTVIDNGNGCSLNGVYTVGNTSSGMVATAIITDENCASVDGAIDLSVSGGVGPYSFTWDNGASTEDISGLAAGSYTVTILDQNDGCTIIETYTVGSSTSGMVVSDVVVDENCSGADGSIDLTVTSGVGPFTFVWDNGATTEDLTGLTPGNYTVTVTDQNDGCNFIQTYTVNSGGTFNIDLISVTNENCGDGTGAIDIDINGTGTASPTILWSPNGETTEDLSNLSAGTYMVSVINSGGCEMTLSVDVLNDLDFTISSAVTNENCLDAAGAIDLTVSGSPNISFAWLPNGETTEDLTNLSAGSYDVTVTNDNTGCIHTESFVIANVSTGVAISGAVITDELCGDGSGSIDITVAGGVGPYSYSWTPNGETTEDLSNLNAGTYSVVVTDDNDGCSVSEVFTVNDNVNFTVSGIVQNASCPTCPTGSIDVSINELVADGPYTYLWTPNGETTEDISGLIPGIYSVTVTGASGCSVIMDFTVGNNDDVGISVDEPWLLELFPNPTRTEFTVNYNFNNEDQVVMNMTNVLGDIVLSDVISDQKGNVKFNIEHLSSGVYFINFKTKEADKTVKLIITE